MVSQPTFSSDSTINKCLTHLERLSRGQTCKKCSWCLQYRTGPCNTISYVTSHAFPHRFLSNIFTQLNNRLYKECNLHFFKNLSALCVVQLVVQSSDPKQPFPAPCNKQLNPPLSIERAFLRASNCTGSNKYMPCKYLSRKKT